MQFFTAIYKRIHRALKAELQIHQRLNAEHLSAEEYNAFFDDQQQYDPKADFADDMGISPISDPTVSSKMQALARAQFIDNVWKEHPQIMSEAEVVDRMLQAGGIEDAAKLITPPKPPDPLLQMLGELEAQDKMAGIQEKITNALKNVALAEAAEAGTQLSYYDQFLNYLKTEIDAGQSTGQGQLPGMAGAPDNQMGAAPAPADGSGGGIPNQGAPVPAGMPPGQPGPNVAIPPA